MESNNITILDGSAEEREAIMKDFFGLSEEEFFWDIDISDEDIITEANTKPQQIFPADIDKIL